MSQTTPRIPFQSVAHLDAPLTQLECAHSALILICEGSNDPCVQNALSLIIEVQSAALGDLRATLFSPLEETEMAA